MMDPSPDSPKAVALRWFQEVWNEHRPETVHELMASHARGYSEGGEVTGPGEFVQLVHAPMLDAFPDLRLTVEDAIEEGHQVVIRWVVSAAKPDGAGRFSFAGMTWMIVENGRIVKGWDRFNLHALNHYLTTGEVSPTVRELDAVA